MKSTVFILIFLLLSASSYCQSSKYFRKIIGQPGLLFENGNSIKQLSDGTYALAGVRGDQFDKVDCFVNKIDIFGNVLSEKGIYDSITGHYYENMQVATNGFILTGAVRSYNPLEQFHFLVKTNYDGDTLWTKTIQSSSWNSGGTCVQITNDSGFIVCGYKYGSSSLETNVLKFDSLGNIEFDSVYIGPLIDRASWIEPMGDGSFVFTGIENFNIGGGNAYLHKIDANGNSLWKNIYQYGTDIITDGNTFVKTPHDEFIIAGSSGSGSTYNNPLLIKCDSLGIPVWMKKLSEFPGQFYFGTILKIMMLPNGDIVGCGSMVHTWTALNYRMTLFRTDSTGELKWIRFFTPDVTHDAYGYDMDTTSDGGFIISGRRDTVNGADIYLVKTNCLGFVGKPKADFSVYWNGSLATFTNLSLRADTCIYYFGDGDSAIVQLTDTVNMTHLYSGAGPWQAYMIAYACGEADTIFQTVITGIDEAVDFYNKTFRIHPNPAAESATIEYRVLPNVKNAFLLISDLMGRIILEKELTINSEQVTIDLTNISKGSYQVVLMTNGFKKAVKTLVKI